MLSIADGKALWVRVMDKSSCGRRAYKIERETLSHRTQHDKCLIVEYNELVSVNDQELVLRYKEKESE